MSNYLLQKECMISRPVDVVRAHFLDFEHHIKHGVHKGIEYTVLERSDRGQRVRSRFKVLGMPKVDEVFVRLDEHGSVEQQFLRGDFEGGKLRVSFRDAGHNRTHLVATFDVPLRGMNWLLAPLVKRTVSKLADQTIEEDRIDLEQKGYRAAGV